jgi:hypothetical protein
MSKVDWTKWSAIAEILSAIAIVFTLVYLAVQTQYLAEQTEQNNALMQAQARADREEVRRLSLARRMENQDLLRAIAKANDGAELTDVEALLLDSHNTATLMDWQYIVSEFRRGLLEAEALPVEAWRRVFRRDPGLIEQWAVQKYEVDPSFAEWMDANIANP